jgi:hypothetical protein
MCWGTVQDGGGLRFRCQGLPACFKCFLVSRLWQAQMSMIQWRKTEMSLSVVSQKLLLHQPPHARREGASQLWMVMSLSGGTNRKNRKPSHIMTMVIRMSGWFKGTMIAEIAQKWKENRCWNVPLVMHCRDIRSILRSSDRSRPTYVTYV